MDEEDFISSFRQGRGASRGPGAVVGTIRSGASRMASAGLADIENGIPIGEGSSFHVASVAKQFTAYLVASLAAERRLDLDQPIGEGLDWLQPSSARCTVRQLLFHTSGLRDHWSLSEYAGLRDGDSITTADACGWIASQSELNFPSGTRFVYSNSGYVLLARLVEQLEGCDFAAAAKRRIFQPLGMAGTFFVDRPDMVIPRRVRGYRQEGDAWLRCDPNYGVVGATCLRTNVDDMLRWLATTVDDPFFAAVGALGYFEPGRLDDGTPIRYGFGQIHALLGGRDVIMHGGYDYGFNAITIRDRRTGDALFASSNGSTAGIEGAAMAWFAGWNAEGGQRAGPAKAGLATAGVERLVPGVYARDDMTDVRVISEAGGRLTMFWSRDMDLEPTEFGEWSVVGTSTTARPEGTALVLSNGIESVSMERLRDEPFDASKLDGSYYCDSLHSAMRIQTRGGRTTILIGRGDEHRLKPVNASLLLFGSNWMTIDWRGGQVALLRLHQARCSGIAFRPLGG